MRNPSKLVTFGSVYGDPSAPSFITPEGPVWMWRKGQKVRFFTAEGVQVGPEQRNVGPAVFAAMEAGWIDMSLLRLESYRREMFAA